MSLSSVLLVSAIKAGIVIGFVMSLAALLTWFDRRQGALHQDRIGPHRAVVWVAGWLARLLVLLTGIAMGGAVLILVLAFDRHQPPSMARALLLSHLGLAGLWSTALGVGVQVRRRGPCCALDRLVMSLGRPRRILSAALLGHLALLTIGLVPVGPESGLLLRKVGYLGGASVLAGLVLLVACYLFWQMRGKSRIGVRFFGLLHPLCDVTKLAFKEDLVPPRADRWLHGLGPILALLPVLLVMAVVPLGDRLCFGLDQEGGLDFGRLVPALPRSGVCTQGAVDLMILKADVGLLFVLAVTGFGVLGMVMGGAASDNRYSLLGALRATCQLVSYEVVLGLTAVGAIMTYGTLELDQMVRWQATHVWGVFVQPLGCLLFLAAAIAESKRVPFDLPEGESEIVGGYFTEYSGMKFAMFYTAEYAAVAVNAALLATLFFGGWHVPFLEPDGIRVAVGTRLLLEQPLGHGWVVSLGVLAFLSKTLLLACLQIAIRWTLPRVRFDQLMRLGWRGLLPVSLANILFTALVLLWLKDVSPPVERALGWAAELCRALGVLGPLMALVGLVAYWLRPPPRSLNPPTSAVQLALARGGTRSLPMGD